MNTYKIPTSRLKRLTDSSEKNPPSFLAEYRDKKIPTFLILRKKGEIYIEAHTKLEIYPMHLKNQSTGLFIDEKDLTTVNEKQIQYIFGALSEKELETVFYKYLLDFYEAGKRYSRRTSLISK